jgi:hypothetical protein
METKIAQPANKNVLTKQTHLKIARNPFIIRLLQ